MVLHNVVGLSFTQKRQSHEPNPNPSIIQPSHVILWLTNCSNFFGFSQPKKKRKEKKSFQTILNNLFIPYFYVLMSPVPHLRLLNVINGLAIYNLGWWPMVRILVWCRSEVQILGDDSVTLVWRLDYGSTH